MDIVPYSWNGHDLTVYSAIINDKSPLFGNAKYAEVQRSGTWPVRGGKTFAGNVLILQMVPTAGQSIGTFRNLMGLWFNEETDEEPVLIVTDKNNSNKQWYVNGECLGMLDPSTGYVEVAIHVSDPIWKSVVVDTDTQALTASGQTKSVIVGGNRIARPQYNLKTTGARTGGYGYKRYITICNRTDAVYTDSLIVTGGDFNHSTLVGAGKALANGNDFVIMKNGATL